MVGEEGLELGFSLPARFIVESSRDRGCHSADSVFPHPQARSGFEEGGSGLRKEHARSDSENWRSLREEQEEEEEGSWRLGAGPRRDGDRWRSASPGETEARWVAWGRVEEQKAFWTAVGSKPGSAGGSQGYWWAVK